MVDKLVKWAIMVGHDRNDRMKACIYRCINMFYCHPEPRTLPGTAVVGLCSCVCKGRVSFGHTTGGYYHHHFPGEETKVLKKILHDLVVKEKLESNESFLKLKFERNRKKNIVVTKQWDDFLIWLQELALKIILNQ